MTTCQLALGWCKKSGMPWIMMSGMVRVSSLLLLLTILPFNTGNLLCTYSLVVSLYACCFIQCL